MTSLVLFRMLPRGSALWKLCYSGTSPSNRMTPWQLSVIKYRQCLHSARREWPTKGFQSPWVCHLQTGTQLEKLQIDLLFSPCGICGQSTLPFMNYGGS